ncbi:MAG: hypothetical protein HFH49_13130 [Lachnospiraceae bacterium]|nr:hypothetical protein [Lachnospiraceae bacterium]
MNWLKEDDTLINNLYDSKIRKTWESELSQDDNRTEEYKVIAKKTIEYIEKTQDQMPAYIGWTSDFNIIVEFLNDLIQYDICDAKRYFKFISHKTL